MLKKHPHGIDLGALKPCLPERLFTSDKKINLAPELFINDIHRLKQKGLVSKKDGPALQLIGRRQLRNNNSWMHNAQLLMTGKERCTLLIHPEDAVKQGFTNHQKVRVTSSMSSVEIPLEISDQIMQGVVSIPHGFGHHRLGTNIALAEANAGVSINDLTDTNHLDVLTGNADFSRTEVTIEAI